MDLASCNSDNDDLEIERQDTPNTDQKESLLLNETSESEIRFLRPCEDKAAGWYMLLVFSLCTMMSGLSWICFAPIFDLLQEVYGLKLLTINYMSMSYCLLFLPMNFPSTYVLDKYGLRVGVVVGFFIQALGMWCRCLVNKFFWFVVMGQTLTAIGQPFTYNAPAKLSANWFEPKSRTVATMFGVNANILGNLLGFLIPRFFVHPTYDPDVAHTP